MNCLICKSVINAEPIKVSEKMFGTKEVFNYCICPTCNCLQIVKIPDNLNQYYPANYYSFHIDDKISFKKKIKQWMYNYRSFIIQDFYKKPSFAACGLIYTDKRKAIIDIGCGSGKLLLEMKENGFTHLLGVDPYIEKDILLNKGYKILKKNIQEITGQYDIIMSHHSLEHMTNPHDLFKIVKKILKVNGRFILRIPIYPNYIWDIYKEHWIQIDAPRHLFLFSITTMDYLCNLYGLKIVETKYDAHPWALASTEFCLNGGTHVEYQKDVKISSEQVQLCDEANENKNGDSVCFIIKHKDE